MNQEPKKWLKDPEMITALSAVFIGVVALIIGAYQAKVASDQRAASVWPYLEINRHSLEGEKYSFNIINKGVGPALIKRMDVLIDNKPMQGWTSAFQNMLGEKINIKSINSTTNKAVLAVQESKTMIDIKDKAVITKIQSVSDKTIDIKVCYCSIFKDCWLSSKENETIEVKSCENVLDNVFRQ